MKYLVEEDKCNVLTSCIYCKKRTHIDNHVKSTPIFEYREERGKEEMLAAGGKKILVKIMFLLLPEALMLC